MALLGPEAPQKPQNTAPRLFRLCLWACLGDGQKQLGIQLMLRL
jgi:hypothetical protein